MRAFSVHNVHRYGYPLEFGYLILNGNIPLITNNKMS